MSPIIICVIVATVLVFCVASMLIATFPIANKVYRNQLVRTDESVWGRACSAPNNAEQVEMWNEGVAWAETVKDFCSEVHIVNDGYNLYGEYYDFGSRDCVIILPGRCECLMYSYFYAKPYRDAGYNVLVIDTRCHGKSDGKYSSIGKNEHRDVLAWADFLIKNKNIQKICLHCICIGSASGILACVSDKCPSEIKEIVVEGVFTNFRESFKEHMIALKRPVFPVCDEVMALLFLKTGANVFAISPKKNLKKLNKRILFLHSRQDLFSKPEKAQKMFETCPSKDKRFVWFDKGGHSHIRINNHEKYDNEVIKFLNDGRR